MDSIMDEFIFEEEIEEQFDQHQEMGKKTKRTYCKWTIEKEKLLLEKYEKNYGKFGPKFRFKNKEKFLEFLTMEINEHGYDFSLTQV